MLRPAQASMMHPCTIASATNGCKKNKTNLWLSLLNVCSPDHNTDPIAAVRELRQGYSEDNINPQSMPTCHYTSLFMMTLGAIIENDTPLLNYASQYIAGLNENLKLQVEAVFDAHIGPQVMTRAVQTKNLNDAVSAVARTDKSNTATLALIDQRNAGITNFLCRLTNDPAAVSNESANSATGVPS